MALPRGKARANFKVSVMARLVRYGVTPSQEIKVAFPGSKPACGRPPAIVWVSKSTGAKTSASGTGIPAWSNWARFQCSRQRSLCRPSGVGFQLGRVFGAQNTQGQGVVEHPRLVEHLVGGAMHGNVRCRLTGAICFHEFLQLDRGFTSIAVGPGRWRNDAGGMHQNRWIEKAVLRAEMVPPCFRNRRGTRNSPWPGFMPYLSWPQIGLLWKRFSR